MKEKTIKSPNEQGEYLLYDDTVEDMLNGVWTELPCVAVSFRKTISDGTPDEYDFEHWKTFATWDEAEEAVNAEIAKAKT